MIIIASFTGLIVVIGHSDSDIMKGLIEKQKETLQEGKEYIRIQSGVYFLKDFSPDVLCDVLGNGVPYKGVSSYGLFIDLLNKEGFFLEDVGIIAFYAMFGILAIIAYVIIWIKSFTLPLPKEYYYVKYYLWFLLITSLTSDNVYSYSYLISTVFALYIYQYIFFKHKDVGVDLTLKKY